MAGFCSQMLMTEALRQLSARPVEDAMKAAFARTQEGLVKHGGVDKQVCLARQRRTEFSPKNVKSGQGVHMSEFRGVACFLGNPIFGIMAFHQSGGCRGGSLIFVFF